MAGCGKEWLKKKIKVCLQEYASKIQKKFPRIPAAVIFFAKKITKDHLPVVGSKRKTDMFYQ